MNRLVLVGNGFDLAMGFKTGYNDFLVHLLKKYLNLADANRLKERNPAWKKGFENNLVSITFPSHYSKMDSEISALESMLGIQRFMKGYNITFKIKSKLFQMIYSNAGRWGWVDIEEKYYTLLKESIRPNEYGIDEVNKDLSEISKELEMYLAEITAAEIEWSNGLAFANQFDAEIKVNELSLPSELKENQPPEKICFLNFNYTDILARFLKIFKNNTSSEVELIQIHGELNDEENPMIFGFGDEIDDQYHTIEKKNDNRFFQHIKSFGYFKAPNYHKALRFLDSEVFQVYIYGHSCGLSDRTLLSEIFNHQNCRSIKIFYYQNEKGENDFTNKTMDISRHFSDKASMRKKLVNRTFCGPIPQNKEKDKPAIA